MHRFDAIASEIIHFTQWSMLLLGVVIVGHMILHSCIADSSHYSSSRPRVRIESIIQEELRCAKHPTEMMIGKPFVRAYSKYIRALRNPAPIKVQPSTWKRDQQLLGNRPSITFPKPPQEAQ